MEEVGRLLGSGTMTEEVQHANISIKKMTEEIADAQVYTFGINSTESCTHQNAYTSYNERLNQHPFIEALLRPPIFL